jgi:heme-degrading monooxygenase HmoA
MFVVVYELRIKSGYEESFRKAWHDVTKQVITNNGSLGARLHLRDDGAFIAYAQWPTREQWAASHHHIQETAVKMHLDDEFIEVPTVVMEMEMLDDLLVEPDERK